MEFHECALIGVCAVIRSNTVKHQIIIMTTVSHYTVNPHYTDTRYNDKIRYNDNLNVTKPSLKR